MGSRGLETLHTGCPAVAGEPSVRPASPTSHLPLRRRVPLRISRHPRCPGQLRSAPRLPGCIPCGLRSWEKKKPGGALRPTWTPTHHIDMAARSRVAERSARITALSAAAGDGWTGPGRAPVETFFSRLEAGPQGGGRPRYVNPSRPGSPWGTGTTLSPGHFRGTPRRIARGRNGISET